MTLRVVPPPSRPSREAICAACESTFKVELEPTTEEHVRVYRGACETCGTAAVLTYVSPRPPTMNLAG